jgi:hypothetical protein
LFALVKIMDRGFGVVFLWILQCSVLVKKVPVRGSCTSSLASQYVNP